MSDATGSKARVLIVCVHNSARSQMAEEYFRSFGGDIFEVESAGIEPGTLNPYVVEVLKEEGIDISGKQTRSASALAKEGRGYEYVITVCSKEAADKCPVYPSTIARMHWPFDDPSSFPGEGDARLEATRTVRDQIKDKVAGFVARYREDPEAAIAEAATE